MENVREIVKQSPFFQLMGICGCLRDEERGLDGKRTAHETFYRSKKLNI